MKKPSERELRGQLIESPLAGFTVAKLITCWLQLLESRHYECTNIKDEWKPRFHTVPSTPGRSSGSRSGSGGAFGRSRERGERGA